MADIKYYDVILKPVITEKSMAAMGEKKYTFLVHVDAWLPVKPLKPKKLSFS